MADPVTKPAKPAGKKDGPLGIPVWGWAVGGVALVVGYLWFKSHSSSSSSGSSGTAKSGGGAAGPGGGNERFTEVIREWQGHRKPPKITVPPNNRTA